MKRLTVIALCLICPAGLTPVCAAEEPADEKSPATDKPARPAETSADAVKVLIQQLESGKYKERNEATRKLMAAGKNVIEPVTKAAHTDDLELGARCVDVLKHLYQNGDATTKAAAGASLKKLQQSKHASVAKWAAEALGRGNAPFGINPFGGRFRGRFGGGRIIIGGGFPGGFPQPAGLEREANVTENGKKIHIKETIGRAAQIVVKITEKVNGKEKTTEYKARSRGELRRKNKEIYDLYRKHIGKARFKIIGMNNLPIQIPGQRIPRGGFGGAGGIRINTRNVNGNREIDIEANGRKISISDNQGKDIVVKITETVGGKAKTTEHKAKDVEELKKKHPKAAKIYEQYTKAGGIRFGGFAEGARGFFPRGGGRNPRQRPNRPARPPMEKPE